MVAPSWPSSVCRTDIAEDLDVNQAHANAALIRGYWPEANAAGLLSIVDRYHAPGVISYPPASASPEPLVGLDAYKRFVVERFYGTFPDLQTTIHELVAENDMVGIRVTAAGTQSGPLMGMPPTGKRVEFSGAELFRIRDGRIVEQWGEFDGVAILQQLGLMPQPDGDTSIGGSQLSVVGERTAEDNRSVGKGSAEANRAVVRHFYDLCFNRPDVEWVDELTTPDVALRHGGTMQDRATGKQLVAAFQAAFPDAKNAVELMLADEHGVFTRGLFTGTHRGEFMGLQPTHRAVRMSWMALDHVANGRITARWVEQDTLGLLAQLGALPAPTAAPAP
jgi:predicted ester cyclase